MLTSEYPYFEFPFLTFNIAQSSVIPMIMEDNNLVICFNTAVGKCLQYNSRVLLANGNYQKIGEICENNSPVEVASLNTETLKLERSLAYPVIKDVSDDLIKIKTKKGNVLTTTREHPFLIKSDNGLKWQRADELKCGDYLATPKNNSKIILRNNISMFNFWKEITTGYIYDKQLIREVLSSTKMKKRALNSFISLSLNISLGLIQKWRSKGIIKVEIFIELCKIINFNIEQRPITIKNSNTSKKFTLPVNMNEDIAWLLGMVFGDGTIGKNHKLRISNIDCGVLNKINKVLERTFNTYSKNIFQGVGIWLSPLCEVFEKMGVPIGKKSDIIIVPSYIFSANNSIVSNFIAGFFDADGYVSKNGHIECYSNSEEFIFGIQTLLMRFGIKSYKKEKLYKNKLRHRCAIYRNEDINLFHKNIKFHETSRSQLISEIPKISKNTNDYIVPNVSKELKLLKENLSKKSCELDYSIRSAIYSRNHISVYKLKTFITENNIEGHLFNKIIDADIEFEKIISIENHSGEEKVYDLTVYKNHNFIAENIICHNTCLAEAAFGYHLATDKNCKVVYVVPYKSLGNEKYEEWTTNKNFSKYKIVLNTSDNEITGDDLKTARIIITTSESLDSKARSQSNASWIKKIKCIVMDEAHLVGTEGRGCAIESSLMRLTDLNPGMRIILLSATMTNSLSIAKWIKALNGKPTKKIESDWRPNEIKMRIFPFNDSNNTEDNKMKSILEVLQNSYSFGQKTIIFVHSKIFGEKLRKEISKLGFQCAFHNASLNVKNRKKIEKSFDDPSSGFDILVSTSTLSAGVNIG